MSVIDPSDSNPLAGLSPSPRCSVYCDRGGGTWSPLFGESVLLASGLRNVVGMPGMRSIGTWPGTRRSRSGRGGRRWTSPTQMLTKRRRPRGDGGEPDRRHRHARQRGRSPEAREHRRRRWREQRAPVSATP